MKIHEVLDRAAKDPKFAVQLRRLAADSRDKGKLSSSYQQLAEIFAETPGDLLALNSTLGYLATTAVTNSKICLPYPRPGEEEERRPAPRRQAGARTSPTKRSRTAAGPGRGKTRG